MPGPARTDDPAPAPAAPGFPAPGRGVPEPAVRDAVEFLRAHSREPVGVPDVADAVGYSAPHFSRLFAHGTGCPPARYLAALRFDDAKRLLLGGCGVTEAAHTVGFTSHGTFTRRFGLEVGVAPSSLPRLADRLADTTLRPFARPAAHVLGTVRVRPVLGDALRRALGPRPQLWLGMFPGPAPAGVPLCGVLHDGVDDVVLPVPAGAPWLLSTVVPGAADPQEHLAPRAPVVAVHGAPLTGDAAVQLHYRPARSWNLPILTALAALSPQC